MKDQEKWKKRLINLYAELAQSELNMKDDSSNDKALETLNKAYELAISTYGNSAVEVAHIAHQMAEVYSIMQGYKAEGEP